MVKKVYRKKRAIRKKRAYKRIPRSLAPKNVHYFKRHAVIGDVTKSANSLAFLSGYDFQLTDVPNYSEFTALFDSYKICAIKFIFIPGWTQSQVDVNTGAPVSAQINLGCARIFSSLDYNDSSNPGGINDIREYANCKMTSFVRGHKRYFKPKIVDSAGAYNTSGWVDTSVPTKVYYGVKFGIDFNGYSFLSTTIVGKLEAIYYIKCKSVR